MFHRTYQIQTRSAHGRYVDRWGNLNATQAKLYWEGLNTFGEGNYARLLEFDGYTTRVIARRTGDAHGFTTWYPKDARHA